jgi:phosphate transport system permease protein
MITASANLRRRKAVNTVMVGVTYFAAFVATVPLLAILGYLIYKGAATVNVSFFIHLPKPAGTPGGGMANGIAGTIVLVSIACIMGLPVGIGAGLYLAEQREAPLATLVRFLADVLNGLPSIVMGIFAWQIFVRPMHTYSAVAGGIALGALMIPMVTRTTEEMVRLVPVSLREAALALGYTRWRTSLQIVLRTALGGIVTGALVSISRIAGETAPLLFTALGNQFWSKSLWQPMAALPLQVFNYATSAYDDWHDQAWSGALVLLSLVLVISLIARIVTRARYSVGD